jgi:hypothetical protein
MGYQMTHTLANGIIAVLSTGKPGQYAVYGPDRKFLTYAKSLAAAKEFAKNYMAPVNSGL